MPLQGVVTGLICKWPLEGPRRPLKSSLGVRVPKKSYKGLTEASRGLLSVFDDVFHCVYINCCWITHSVQSKYFGCVIS